MTVQGKVPLFLSVSDTIPEGDPYSNSAALQGMPMDIPSWPFSPLQSISKGIPSYGIGYIPTVCYCFILIIAPSAVPESLPRSLRPFVLSRPVFSFHPGSEKLRNRLHPPHTRSGTPLLPGNPHRRLQCG